MVIDPLELRKFLEKIHHHETPAIAHKKHIVIAGPSGSGKTSIIIKDPHSIIKTKPEIYDFSVSGATRQPRGNEISGKDYYFFDTIEAFEEEEFLEDNKYEGNKNLYGTLRSEVHRITILLRKRCCFDVDINGGKALKAMFKSDLLFGYLQVDEENLYHRLKGRQHETHETDDQISARIEAAKKEHLRIQKQEIIPDFILDYNKISAGEAAAEFLKKAS